jgi:hypothetical protein
MKASSALLIVVSFLLVCGCSKKEQAKGSNGGPEEVRPEEPLEPLTVTPAHIEALPPENFLHKVFAVNGHAEFSFVVSPHQDNTRLRGTFRSFTKRNDPDSSDGTANVDLLLLNEQEFEQLLHGQPQSVTYELDSAHNHVVDWRVPATYGEPQTYHLVFSNSSRTKTKFVQADFTVSFE